jgi:hypothetical protein
LDKLDGREVQAWWFDPRTGEAKAVGQFAGEGEREFTPPGHPGAGNDWVLALDGKPKFNLDRFDDAYLQLETDGL